MTRSLKTKFMSSSKHARNDACCLCNCGFGYSLSLRADISVISFSKLKHANRNHFKMSPGHRPLPLPLRVSQILPVHHCSALFLVKCNLIQRTYLRRIQNRLNVLDQPFLVLLNFRVHLNRLLYQQFDISQLAEVEVAFPFQSLDGSL